MFREDRRTKDGLQCWQSLGFGAGNTDKHACWASFGCTWMAWRLRVADTRSQTCLELGLIEMFSADRRTKDGLKS